MSRQTAHIGAQRLKNLRNYHNKTQLDVELDANLGIGYLQRVESGKVQQPEADTLQRILNALEAPYAIRREILQLFGYQVAAPIPTEPEIQTAISQCQSELDTATFPAYLLDCSHRLLTWNAFVPEIFLLNLTTSSYLPMLKLIFDPAYQFNERIMNRQYFSLAQIRAFRYEMQWFQDEAWYQQLLEDMLNIATFRSIWLETQQQPIHFAARPLTPLHLEIANQTILKFHLISETFVQDNRFRIIYLIPADALTTEHCQRLQSQFSQS